MTEGLIQTSMPLTYPGRIPQGRIAAGLQTDDPRQMNLVLMLCLVLSFLYYFVAFVSFLFQIDTNKSITQKRLKKVSGPIAISSFPCLRASSLRAAA